MNIKCKCGFHKWRITSTPELGPIFRICERCGRYEDAIPDHLYQRFHFRKIKPNGINSQTLKQWIKINTPLA